MTIVRAPDGQLLDLSKPDFYTQRYNKVWKQWNEDETKNLPEYLITSLLELNHDKLDQEYKRIVWLGSGCGWPAYYLEKKKEYWDISAYEKEPTAIKFLQEHKKHIKVKSCDLNSTNHVLKVLIQPSTGTKIEETKTEKETKELLKSKNDKQFEPKLNVEFKWEIETQLTARKWIYDDLQVGVCNIVALDIMQYLEYPTVCKLMFDVLDLAQPGSVFLLATTIRIEPEKISGCTAKKCFCKNDRFHHQQNIFIDDVFHHTKESVAAATRGKKLLTGYLKPNFLRSFIGARIDWLTRHYDQSPIHNKSGEHPDDRTEVTILIKRAA